MGSYRSTSQFSFKEDFPIKSKGNYFVILALIGVVLEFLMAWSIMGTSLMMFWEDTQKNASAPIFVGILGTLLGAIALDHGQFFKKNLIKKIFLGTPIVFLSGAVLGCLANFFHSANLSNPYFGYWNEIVDWLLKPLYWLLIIGLPSSLVIGVLYGASYLKLKKVNL